MTVTALRSIPGEAETAMGAVPCRWSRFTGDSCLRLKCFRRQPRFWGSNAVRNEVRESPKWPRHKGEQQCGRAGCRPPNGRVERADFAEKERTHQRQEGKEERPEYQGNRHMKGDSHAWRQLLIGFK